MNFQLFKLDLEKVASQSTSLSRVRLFATPWTVAYQAPPSMAFSRHEYWSGLKEPEIKLSTSVGSSKKQDSSRKNIYFCFMDYAKVFDCVDHNKLWKLLREMGKQTTWPASWEICMQVRKQQLELDMEQQTSSKSGKKYVKAVYCHPVYLTYMQSTSWEMLGWKKHKLKQDF